MEISPKPPGYSITIPGVPIIQERPRLGKHRQVYDPTSKAKKDLGMHLLYGREQAKSKVLAGLIGMEVIFYGLKKGDLDNALKALLDASNGVLFLDDRQVCEVHVQVIREDVNPRTLLVIREIG